MALPKAIQRQAEMAQQIDAQIAQEAGTPATSQAPVPVSDDPSMQLQAAPEAQQAAPAPAPTESKPDAAPRVEQDDVWKRRYDSLRGKYDAEVPQLHSQLRAQGEQLQAIAQQLQEVKAKTPTEQEKPLVTTEDETAFGPDLVDLIRRVSRTEFAAGIEKLMPVLTSKIDTVEKSVSTVSARQQADAEGKFWARLNKLVPDWQEMNVDQQFLSWLASINPVVNVPYQSILVAAQQALNADQVAAVFDEFKRIHGGKKPTPPTTDQASQTDQELESLVSPSTSRSNTPAPQGDKRIWSGKDYAAAYDPRLRNTKSKEEIAKLQAAADLAVAEGRIQW